MDWLKSKGKMFNGRWIPRRKMRMVPRKRSSPLEQIDALRAAEDGQGVCERCARIEERNQLTEAWIGKGTRVEGIVLCRNCVGAFSKEVRNDV